MKGSILSTRPSYETLELGASGLFSMSVVASKAVKDKEVERPGRINCLRYRVLREWQIEITILSIYKVHLSLPRQRATCVYLGKACNYSVLQFSQL